MLLAIEEGLKIADEKLEGYVQDLKRDRENKGDREAWPLCRRKKTITKTAVLMAKLSFLRQVTLTNSMKPAASLARTAFHSECYA